MTEISMSPYKIREGYEVYLPDVRSWHVVGHIETVPTAKGDQVRAWFAQSSHYVRLHYPSYQVRVPDLSADEQAALDEQVARIDQFERIEEEWYSHQSPEVQAAYDRYVAEAVHVEITHADEEK